MSALPDKILDAIAGEPCGLRSDFRQNELADPESNLVQEKILPRLLERDEDFYRFFCFGETLVDKSWGKSKSMKGFTREIPFKYASKMKEIERAIREIDPALLGEKRSDKEWFWQRLIDIVHSIFRRIFTPNSTINTLFCCRRSLEERFKDLKLTIRLSLKTEITEPAQILPQIQEIIQTGFPEEAEATMINYILETALPQTNLNSFTYDKETGNFTLRYHHPHTYKAQLHLKAVGMGRVTLVVVCAETVEGNIDAFEKKVSFASGISVQKVVFVDKETLFFSKPIATKIEKNSNSEHPPSLAFIQMLEEGKIKVKGSTTLTIPDWLTSPTLSYGAVERNLSKIIWERQEVTV